jgi:lipoyl(octanoyl) transferase
MPEITVLRLGQMPFQQAWEVQENLFQGIIQQKLADGKYSGSGFLLLVEHPPVFTLGKSGKAEHLLHPAENAVDVFRINRGGDITFHGPGQLVAYPILDLEQYFTDIKKYMRSLEEVVIRVLQDYGISGHRVKDATGVWLDPDDGFRARKIGALGVRTSRWVTMHGLALNVSTDLDYFDQIIPCGIRDKGVTSMQKELGRAIPLQEVAEKLIIHFGEVFQAKMLEGDAERYRV